METITNNINNILNMADYYSFEEGLTWYDDARKYCRMLSVKYNKPFISICAAMAALSPRNKWNRNKIDLHALVSGDDSHGYGTFKAMVNKAKMCLEHDNHAVLMTILNGPKIQAFFDNIYDENSQLVTVDFHMYNIAMGKYIPEDERRMRVSVMRDITIAIENVAHKHKLRPYELQAILWVTWRGSHE